MIMFAVVIDVKIFVSHLLYLFVLFSACRLYGFLGGLTGTLSIITLSVISFDRYFVIKFPLKRSLSEVRIKISLVVAWMYGSVFAIIPALDIGLGKYAYEGYLTSCSFDYLTDDPKIKVFILVFFVAAWVVPFILISFSYFNIMKVVAGRTISQKRGRDSFRHVKEEDNKKQEIKLALVVLSTIMMWFFSWTPYAVVALLGISDQKQIITPLTSMIPAIFCKAASCINPYVYALSHPKFKKELRKICCFQLKKKRENNRKVWHTDLPRTQMQMEHVDSEEEMVEVRLGNIKPGTSIIQQEPSNKTIHQKRSLKREETVIELLCLRPSFKNKPSSFRRIARRWSSRDKQRNETEENESDIDTDMQQQSSQSIM
nr:opsin, ultraviolet-sensitive-like [Leptinotarsa decemlineata]